jgi:RHS repeat-associated protein
MRYDAAIKTGIEKMRIQGVCLQNIFDYSPFGVTLDGRTIENDFYRRGFNGMEKDDEVKGEGNSYTTEFRQLDPRVGRWLSLDPLVEKFPSHSPFNYCLNNPLNKIDPSGMEPYDWVRTSTREMVYDNRVTNQATATELYGSNAIYRPVGYKYTSSDTKEEIELGDYGFFKKNGEINSSPDQAEVALKNADIEIANLRRSYSSLIGVVGFISTDVAIPDPSDLALPKWVGYAVTGFVAAYYIEKMEKEIEGIQQKVGGPPGAQYSLKATATGNYPCFNCPTGNMTLDKGDVWKYGETTNISGRYYDSYLNGLGVKQENEFFGNQVQIKVMEKKKLYSYFLQNGHLPPGNKIFR